MTSNRLRTFATLAVATLAMLLASSAAPAADDYKLGPDSERQEGVPEGNVTKHHWTSKVFPGTVRDYWVYVPAAVRRQDSRPA